MMTRHAEEAFNPFPPVNDADRRRHAAHARLQQVLPALCEFVRQDLAYREAVGDVAPGMLTADDVVDAVVLAAHRDLMSGLGEQRLVAKLRELAVQHITREMTHVAANRGPAAVEEDVSAVPSQQQVTLLDPKILYFFDPEGDLKAEDVDADPQAPAPHEWPDTDELHRCLERACQGMPPVWRRAIFSRHVDGLSGEALARAVGRSIEEVQRMIEHARAYLREQLLDARSNSRTHAPH